MRQYQRFGVSGLEVRQSKKVYAGTFKVTVLNWMKTNQASLTETALNFDISSPAAVWQWQRTFENDGPDALFRNRGRSKIMSANKPGKKTKQPDELARLRDENELLKIENDYLKKLKALAQSQADNEHKSSKN